MTTKPRKKLRESSEPLSGLAPLAHSKGSKARRVAPKRTTNGLVFPLEHNIAAFLPSATSTRGLMYIEPMGSKARRVAPKRTKRSAQLLMLHRLYVLHNAHSVNDNNDVSLTRKHCFIR